MVNELDYKTAEAVNNLGKVTRAMAQYADLDTRLSQYVSVDAGKTKKIEAEFDALKFKGKLDDDAIKKADREI